MDESPESQTRHYELWIRLADASSPWHATLTGFDGTPALDFETPLDLVRFLASQQNRGSESGLR